MPRPAPDLDLRRDQIVVAARRLAEADGWPAVTMRRLAGSLSATQPVLYSAFESRQALIDAVALSGFTELAEALSESALTPMARMRVYLDFAAANPRVYEAMFSLPSGLGFASEDKLEPLESCFICIRDAFPDADGTRAELVWATLHGLATLEASRRLRPTHTQDRLDLAHHTLTQAAERG